MAPVGMQTLPLPEEQRMDEDLGAIYRWATNSTNQPINQFVSTLCLTHSLASWLCRAAGSFGSPADIPR